MIAFIQEEREPRSIDWRGSALDDLRQFPEDVRSAAGRELRKVQFGENPADFKSISNWGPGVFEIRLNAFRVVYIARFDDMIYVLHCFVKKSQKTPQEAVLIVKTRYSEVINERIRRKK